MTPEKIKESLLDLLVELRTAESVKDSYELGILYGVGLCIQHIEELEKIDEGL